MTELNLLINPEQYFATGEVAANGLQYPFGALFATMLNSNNGTVTSEAKVSGVPVVFDNTAFHTNDWLLIREPQKALVDPLLLSQINNGQPYPTRIEPDSGGENSVEEQETSSDNLQALSIYYPTISSELSGIVNFELSTELTLASSDDGVTQPVLSPATELVSQQVLDLQESVGQLVLDLQDSSNSGAFNTFESLISNGLQVAPGTSRLLLNERDTLGQVVLNTEKLPILVPEPLDNLTTVINSITDADADADTAFPVAPDADSLFFAETTDFLVSVPIEQPLNLASFGNVEFQWHLLPGRLIPNNAMAHGYLSYLPGVDMRFNDVDIPVNNLVSTGDKNTINYEQSRQRFSVNSAVKGDIKGTHDAVFQQHQNTRMNQSLGAKKQAVQQLTQGQLFDIAKWSSLITSSVDGDTFYYRDYRMTQKESDSLKERLIHSALFEHSQVNKLVINGRLAWSFAQEEK